MGWGRCSLVLMLYFGHLVVVSVVTTQPCSREHTPTRDQDCIDGDDCDKNQPLAIRECGDNTECYNTQVRGRCSCKDGYISTSGEIYFDKRTDCVDINECDDDGELCGPNASCHNTVGSYYCSCNHGFESSGEIHFLALTKTRCRDINECDDYDDAQLCGPNASCHNKVGSYDCSCNQGFVSSGETHSFDSTKTRCRGIPSGVHTRLREWEAPDNRNTTVLENGNTTVPDNGNTTVPDNRNTTVHDNGYIKVPNNGNTTVPDNRNTTVPDNRNTTVPDNRNTTVHDNGYIKVPNNGNTTVPNNGNTTVHNNGNTTVLENGNTTVPDNRNTTVPNNGNTTVPDNGYTKVPNNGYTTMPDNGNTTMPDNGYTTMPDNGNTTVPNNEYTTVPDNGYTTMPENGYTTVPDNGITTVPDNGYTTMPDNGYTTVPDNGYTKLPNNGNTSMPDNRNTTVPDNGNTTVPDNGNTTLPDNGNTTMPDNGNTTVSDNGYTTVPDNGYTMVPNNLYTTVPDNGYTMVPNNLYTTVPDNGYTTMPDNGYTTVPDNGYTTVPDNGYTTVPDNGNTTVPDNGNATELDNGNTPAPASASSADHPSDVRSHNDSAVGQRGSSLSAAPEQPASLGGLFCSMMTNASRLVDKKLCHKSAKGLLIEDVISFTTRLLTGDSLLKNMGREERLNSASNILQAVERAAVAAALSSADQGIRDITGKNMDLQLRVIHVNSTPTDDRVRLQAKENAMDISWRTVAGTKMTGLVAVAFIVYNNMDSILHGARYENKKAGDIYKDVQLNSRVISATVGSSTNCKFAMATNFTLKHKELQDYSHDALSVITFIGIPISLACLAFAVGTFVFCSQARNAITATHTQLCVSLFLAELLFITGIDRTRNRTECGIIAGCLHYLFLTAFVWMSLESMQLYLMVRNLKNMRVSHSSNIRKYIYPLGYGSPALIVAVSAAIYPNGYGSQRNCWLQIENGFVWSFLGPVYLITLVNTFLFTTTLYTLNEELSNRDVKVSKIKDTRMLTFKAIAQVFILGCTWILGLFHFQEETVAMAYLFTIVNSFQGTFIFIILCVLNPKIRAEYQKWIITICKTRKSLFESDSTNVPLSVTSETV
ncbi:adhesion G protein-coupled receptor E2-like isoform X2 [Heptranchias perlo]|uniref:adhesion G protein-coupled receptor E2-like isoform X2 n=1 Tax=Heptranchias perlo TaxID=212740 RepID=UPI00355A01D6